MQIPHINIINESYLEMFLFLYSVISTRRLFSDSVAVKFVRRKPFAEHQFCRNNLFLWVLQMKNSILAHWETSTKFYYRRFSDHNLRDVLSDESLQYDITTDLSAVCIDVCDRSIHKFLTRRKLMNLWRLSSLTITRRIILLNRSFKYSLLLQEEEEEDHDDDTQPGRSFVVSWSHFRCHFFLLYCFSFLFAYN